MFNTVYFVIAGAEADHGAISFGMSVAMQTYGPVMALNKKTSTSA